MSRNNHATIDEYLALLAYEQRTALEKLRKAIQAAAPKAEECISYQLPAFRLDGRMLMGFGATSKHCALYLMSDATVEAHKADLKGYDTSKGTIRFQPDSPLPTSLVRKLVRERIAENFEKSKERSMATKKRAAAPKAARAKKDSSKAPSDVNEFMRELDHPLKKEIEAVRKIILGASPDISEGIKWNSVSFRTTEYFVTLNWRTRTAVQLVFHFGAKVKDNTRKLDIPDPAGLIKWLSTDRCLVTLGAGKDIERKRKAFEAIVREWIRHV